MMSQPISTPPRGMPAEQTDFPRLRVGVSSCLLGNKVRFDGGHKRDSFLTDTLGRYVEWVAVCPEVEIGLGTPRETLRLQRQGSHIRLLMPQSGADYTAAMRAYAQRRVIELDAENLDGYILKKDSPTCGMERVRVYEPNGIPHRDGVGMFAQVLMRHCPHLPIEEEGRLHDPRLRENFISRMFAYRRWREMAARGITRANLIRFHEQYKFLLMAHNQEGTRRLGRLLGNAKQFPSDQSLADAYLAEFTAVMRRVPTVRSHTNVLQHLVGYISNQLDNDERAELAETIHQYRRGLLPLIVPLMLLRHYVRKFKTPYLLGQVYLNPHPYELALLNQL
ncbi:MAG: DUF523 and DUF1722 domain-containing protein [Abditibacteriales bacterium]|nr:DUF523 and DUF1722 domain-containing protein [Abditibacteriales bacterium]MDW8366632.1 DUF523 and DUF1722 domain-containing protein [Abditibacteriales bacterium]